MKLSKRIWASFLIIGLTGQFAWTIENMYFNIYLYNTISTNPNNIALMVASSAIVATLTTLVMGAFSDKLGRRKPFISLGYIFWGLSTMAFGLISVENIAKLFPAANAVAAASAVLIIMDCVMTFFGSTANDAAFNAYVTDTTTTGNRGRVESVLAVLPLMSMLIIFGAFDSMTQKGEWQKFFNIFGAMVTVTGLVSLVLLKDSKVVQSDKTEDHYLRSLVHGFKPSVIRNNPSIYLALTALGIFSIAVQAFFPYLIIYMQHYLQIDAYAIVLGIVLIVASVVSVIGGGFIDKAGKMKFVFPSAIIMFAGLIGMFFARSMVSVIMIGSVMMSGYMLVSATLSAIVRDHTPVDKVGHFQGIRMIFAVLLPMVIGPFIGAAVIINSDSTYVDLGVVKSVPTPSIFLASAAVLLLVTIPILLLRRRKRNENDLG